MKTHDEIATDAAKQLFATARECDRLIQNMSVARWDGQSYLPAAEKVVAEFEERAVQIVSRAIRDAKEQP
jgi:hypothetical protein